MTKPRVIIFNGLSLDGRMDGSSGEIDMGLYYSLAASWKADAMLSGSETMLAAPLEDDMDKAEEPSCDTKELHPLAVPYLVVVDSGGKIHHWRAFKSQPFWRDIVVLCSRATPARYFDELDAVGIHYVISGENKVDFHQALEELNGRFDIQTLRVDSGGILNGVLLREGLVDEVSILIAPVLVGGVSPRSLFVAPDVQSPDQIIRLELLHFEQVTENILWLRYAVVNHLD